MIKFRNQVQWHGSRYNGLKWRTHQILWFYLIWFWFSFGWWLAFVREISSKFSDVVSPKKLDVWCFSLFFYFRILLELGLFSGSVEELICVALSVLFFGFVFASCSLILWILIVSNERRVNYLCTSFNLQF